MSHRIPDYRRQAARAAERMRNEPPPPPVDESRFYNNLAQERFNDSLHKRAIIYEKQLAFPADEDIFGGVMASLEQRGWIYMLNPPVPVCPTLVREFYANILGLRDNILTVRRTRFRFDASAINQCLGVPELPDPDDEFWQMYHQLAVDWEVIRQVIGVPNAEWDWYTSHKVYPQHMKNKYLSEEARIWMKIMHSHLLPNSHTNTIPQDQCVLLFCLVLDLPINLGKLIFENMRTVPVTAKACAYPSLITTLLQRHNVPLPLDEALIAPPAPIKVAPMKRALNTARKKVREAIAAPRPHQASAGPSSSSQPPASSTSDFITRQEFEAAERRANRRYTSLYRALQTVSAQVLLLMDKRKAQAAPQLPPLDPEFLFHGEHHDEEAASEDEDEDDSETEGDDDEDEDAEDSD